jgi:hypothetical protein
MPIAEIFPNLAATKCRTTRCRLPSLFRDDGSGSPASKVKWHKGLPPPRATKGYHTVKRPQVSQCRQVTVEMLGIRRPLQSQVAWWDSQFTKAKFKALSLQKLTRGKYLGSNSPLARNLRTVLRDRSVRHAIVRNDHSLDGVYERTGHEATQEHACFG